MSWLFLGLPIGVALGNWWASRCNIEGCRVCKGDDPRSKQLLAILERIKELDPHQWICVTHGENYYGRECDCRMREVWEDLDKLRPAPSATPDNT